MSDKAPNDFYNMESPENPGPIAGFARYVGKFSLDIIKLTGRTIKHIGSLAIGAAKDK